MFRVATKNTSLPKRLSQVRFQTTTVKPVKKSHPVRRFVFRFGLATCTFYGLGAFLSTKNDQFQEIFVDYVPLGESALDTYDYYSYHTEELFNFSKASETIADVKEKLGLEKTLQIPKQGVTSGTVDPTSTSTQVHESHVGAETTVESHSRAALPLIELKTGDPTVDGTIGSLNDFIVSINKKASDVESQKMVKSLNKSISDLSLKYKELLSSKQEDLAKFLAETESELKLRYENKQVELTTDFIERLTAVKKEVEAKFAEKLLSEVEATKFKIMYEAENIILKSKISAIDEFNKVISEKIDNERDGKLKDLTSLISRVEDIEKLSLELSQTASAYYSYRDIKKSINSIQSIIASNQPSFKCGELLASEIENLKSLTAPLNNELLNVAIDSLPSKADLLLSGGVLTQSQLIARWELLLPELRSVSLLPPNAGLLGHISSFIFSKLLFAKSGAPVKTDADSFGNDVESVIARVNDYLLKNELDNAVEEVTNLKGWARKLADDWLVESRKKLEIQFLVDVVETEINVTV